MNRKILFTLTSEKQARGVSGCQLWVTATQCTIILVLRATNDEEYKEIFQAMNPQPLGVKAGLKTGFPIVGYYLGALLPETVQASMEITFRSPAFNLERRTPNDEIGCFQLSTLNSLPLLSVTSSL
jgi:hypothetical protein